MRRFLMNAFETRSAVIAGLQQQQPGARPAPEEAIPGMRLEVAGFFDDRSTDRLGMDCDVKLIGTA